MVPVLYLQACHNGAILRTMIAKSKAWAQARGLLSISEVHGEEEWEIPTEKEFSLTDKTGHGTTQRASLNAEERGM